MSTPPEIKQPKLAIVVPVYNVARYLRECLDSLLAQTNPNFVVYAVDDGSTDGSGSILENYAKKDPRFIVFHKPNGGVSSARNVALNAIKQNDSFSHIGFIDPDDYVSSRYVERMLNEATETDVDCVICSYHTLFTTGIVDRKVPKANRRILDSAGVILQYTRITADGKRLPSDGATSYFLMNRIYKTSCLKDFRFNEKFRVCEDLDFLFRLLPSLNSGAVISDELYFYRHRKTSLSKNQKQYKLDLQLQVYESLYRDSTDVPKLIAVALQESYIDTVCTWLTHSLWNSGSLKDKRQIFAQSKVALSQNFKFPHLKVNDRRMARLRFGFIFSLLYAKYQQKRYNRKNSKLEQNFFA